MAFHRIPYLFPGYRGTQRENDIKGIGLKVVVVGLSRWGAGAAVFHPAIAVRAVPAPVNQHRFFSNPLLDPFYILWDIVEYPVGKKT